MKSRTQVRELTNSPEPAVQKYVVRVGNRYVTLSSATRGAYYFHANSRLAYACSQTQAQMIADKVGGKIEAAR